MQFLHALVYCWEEACVELWRNRLVNLVSITTIAVSLFILGIFATLSSNLNLLLAGWSERVQLTVYMTDEAGPKQTRDMETFLDSASEVESFDFLSKDDAIQRFRSYFPELGTLTQMLESNPLPASFEIQVAPEYRTVEQVRRFAAQLYTRPGVDEVDYDLLWIERLTAIIDMLQALGFFIGGALVVAAVFTIFNVIKLTVYGRQEEIGIMKLVGATHAYIRGPFVVEGMLQGGLGGTAALGLLYATHELFLRQTLASFRLLTSMEWFRFLSPEGWAVIVLGGMAVGLIGSTLSVRRFLSGPA